MLISRGIVQVAAWAAGCVLVFNLAATAQPPGRQPARRVDGAPQGQARANTDRQPLRKILGRTEKSTPVIDLSTGTFQLRREVFAPPPERRLRRVPSQWRLGVWTDNSPKGLRVREVSRYSPAWRYGVEEGDYILDIMGYPVGYYEGAYYPLTDTLNQVTPRDGWVNILVWNKRTGAEETMWIQAERRGGFGDESSE